MKSPLWLKALAVLGIAGAALSSCSVAPNGPATSGAVFGSLGSPNMSDYYYRRDAGWQYVFQNVENVYNADGSIAQTLTGANDTVTTFGFDGIEPNSGDSLFRYEISYRVSTEYAGRPAMPIYYIPATPSHITNGAYVDLGSNVPGMVLMQRRPRPVSTDTILAGMVGRIRTVTDPFDNSAAGYVFQRDTLWASQHGDSVFLWERFYAGGPLKRERCIFIKDFKNNTTWTYDLVNTPTTTKNIVDVPDMPWSTPAGNFDHVAKIRIYTAEVDDQDFNREWKYYACGTGPVYQYDWWYKTTDGINFIKQDFTRSLISLTNTNQPAPPVAPVQ